MPIPRPLKTTILQNETYHYDYDTHWKEAITYLWKEFLAYFLPKIYLCIDFSIPVEFLEQELHEILPKGFKENKSFGDKVAKVTHKENGEKFLIHTEIQSSHDPKFLRRMYDYHYKLENKEKLPVECIAIYTDDYVHSQYDYYVKKYICTRSTLEFPAYKVKEAPDEELLKSKNPFALIVLTCKYLNSCKKDTHRRFTLKKKLITFVSERNFTQRQTAGVLRFIDLLMRLPKDMQYEVDQLIRKKFFPMNTKSKYRTDMNLSNLMHEAVYGETYDARQERKFLLAAKEFLKNGVAPEIIAVSLNLPLEKILELIPTKGDA